MQCRDDGLLDLDDPIGAHLDVPAHGELTIRRLLSHTAGLQREPFGDVWDTLVAPDRRDARRRPGPRRAGAPAGPPLPLLQPRPSRCSASSVGRLRGGTWAEVLADRILDPLGLADTTLDRPATAAVGYLVDAYSDHARPEPPTDFGAVGPAAQLWSTAADMARWAAFLADPGDSTRTAGAGRGHAGRDALAADHHRRGALGGRLRPRPDPGPAGRPGGARRARRRHARLPRRRLRPARRRAPRRRWAAAVLGSSGTAAEICELPHELLAAAVERRPGRHRAVGARASRRRRSSAACSGRWWGEGFEYVFSWHDGALQARGADDPAGRPPAVFAPLPDEPDVLRTVSGREAGELLRLTRDAGRGGGPDALGHLPLHPGPGDLRRGAGVRPGLTTGEDRSERSPAAMASTSGRRMGTMARRVEPHTMAATTAREREQVAEAPRPTL